MNEKDRPIAHSLQPLLLEEYKIIQSKIDKLGEDKFKVRSWCFTLLTGGVAIAKFSGVLETSRLSPVLFLLFMPAIAAFHLVELRQRQIGKRLGLRAEAIEFSWRRLYNIRGSEIDTPRLASHLIREGRAEKARFSVRSWWQRTFPENVHEKNSPEKRKEFRAARRVPLKPDTTVRDFLIVNADDAFYWMQYLLVVIFIGILAFEGPLNKLPEPKQPGLTQQSGTNGVQSLSTPTNLSVDVTQPVKNNVPTNILTTNIAPTGVKK